MIHESENPGFRHETSTRPKSVRANVIGPEDEIVVQDEVSFEEESSSEPVKAAIEISEERYVEINGERHTFEALNMEEDNQRAAIRVDGEAESIEIDDEVQVSGADFVLSDLDFDTSRIVFDVYDNGNDLEFISPENEEDESSEESEGEEAEETVARNPAQGLEGFELDVSSETVSPGKEIEASVETENEGDYSFDWRLRSLSEEEVREDAGSSISFQAIDDGRTPSLGTIEVRIKREGDYVGELNKDLEWEYFSPDVEGQDVEYGDGEVEISMTQEELRNSPQILVGEAVEALTELKFHHKRAQGGLNLKIEQLEQGEYSSPPENLDVFSVMDFKGEGIQGLWAAPRADLSYEELSEKNLMISEREAKVTYYQVTSDGWEKLPSQTGWAEAENHLQLQPDPDFEKERHEWLMPSGGMTIAVAGSPEGVKDTTYITNGEGDCRELEEGNPVPPGYEELSASCETVEEAEQAKEMLERGREQLQDSKREINERDYNLSEENKDKLDEQEEKLDQAEQDLDEYRVYEAKQKMEEVREELPNLNEEIHREINEKERFRRGGPEADARRIENIDKIIESVEQDLPEELKGMYSHPEEIEEEIDQIKNISDQEERTERTRELSDKIRETEGFQEMRKASEVYEEIESYKERDEFSQLNNETQQQLYTAEEQLLNESIDESESTLSNFERSAEIQIMQKRISELLEDEEIRNAVRDILSQIIPGV